MYWRPKSAAKSNSSRASGKPASTSFYSDVDPSDNAVWASPQKIDVRRDISQVRPSDFDAVVMAANYTSVRLRYPDQLPAEGGEFDPWAHIQSAPVVRFFADAMRQKRVVKGFLCHGLWVLTPNPKRTQRPTPQRSWVSSPWTRPAPAQGVQ